VTGPPVPRVKACLNGSRRPAEHPALPVTAAQLAADARAAMDAGVFAVHVHPRRPDGTQTLEPGPCGEAVAAIRAACPGLPISLSTAAWIEADPERRVALIRAWSPRPDVVSVNLDEAGSVGLVRTLQVLGIGIEAGLSAPADARLLLAEALTGLCTRVLVEPDEAEAEAAVATAAAIDAVLDRAGITLPRVHHGYGRATWAVMTAALARGHAVRAGLEDTLTLPDGRTAAGNAEVIEAALAMAAAR
jgi:uncharacterized protein (DUF849 family)